MSGPVQNIEKGWDLIRKHLELDPPIPMEKYLGCGHKEIIVDEKAFRERMKSILPLAFPESLPVGACRVLPQQDWWYSWHQVNAPKPHLASSRPSKCPLKGIAYDMSDFLDSCIQVYCLLPNVDRATLRTVPTPCLDTDKIDHKDWETPGALAKGDNTPAKIIMKILYCARVARPDLLQST